jgi:2-polyprenyl-3-methyl-5-hydroxy-6-metoxy-1,4-benzoquinol methylase
MTRSTPPAHFDRLYRANADPWQLSSSPYEAAKYAATLQALPRERYAAALEIGCSIGTLTTHLATRCDTVLGVDVVEAPLITARERCAHLPGLRFERRAIPAEWPEGQFDLIMLSEVLYFLSIEDLHAVARHAAASLLPGGTVMLVNWRGPNDGTMTGDAAALTLLQALPAQWRCENAVLLPHYRIDLAERP